MDELDTALAHVADDRRAFLKKAVIGTAFVVPVVSSFTMSGVQAVYAQTAASSSKVSSGNASATTTTTSPNTAPTTTTTTNPNTAPPTTTTTVNPNTAPPIVSDPRVKEHVVPVVW